jgi:acyl carrier protein
MTTETIKQEVIELISELFKDKGYDIDILEYVDLIDDLGMDSITFISIVVEVEARFNIEVPDDMLLLENFKCVDDIVSVVENELSKKLEGTEVIENVET